MGIFDILAESQIQQWLSSGEKDPAEPKKQSQSTEKDKTFEGHLLDQIKRLIEEAAELTGKERESRLLKANGLQVQLLIALEQSGHFMMAKKTEQVLLQHKLKFL